MTRAECVGMGASYTPLWVCTKRVFFTACENLLRQILCSLLDTYLCVRFVFCKASVY